MSTCQHATSFNRYLQCSELFQAPPQVSDDKQLLPALLEAASFDVKVCEYNFLLVFYVVSLRFITNQYLALFRGLSWCFLVQFAFMQYNT